MVELCVCVLHGMYVYYEGEKNYFEVAVMTLSSVSKAYGNCCLLYGHDHDLTPEVLNVFQVP